MNCYTGGYLPNDAPNPEVQQHSQAEVIIVIAAASVGILSAIYFLFFNVYYRKHQ